jgi:hypothetical protein
VRLSPLGTSATVGLLYQPRIIDDNYGAVGAMKIVRGNRSTRRKPAPVPLCLPQIPHDLTWARTRAAAVGSQRLTAWAMARPYCQLKLHCCNNTPQWVYLLFKILLAAVRTETGSSGPFGLKLGFKALVSLECYFCVWLHRGNSTNYLILRFHLCSEHNFPSGPYWVCRI